MPQIPKTINNNTNIIRNGLENSNGTKTCKKKIKTTELLEV